MSDVGIIDAHVHPDDPALIAAYMAAMTEAQAHKMAMVSYAHMGRTPAWKCLGNSNPSVLAAKAAFPDRAYAFGGLNHYPAFCESADAFAEDLVAQAHHLYATGYDGVKLLETKPAWYVTFHYPIGHAVFQAFFETLEHLGLPLIWHVGDPPIFWDEEACPRDAREQGWFYGDDRFPSLEELHEEALGIVARHPSLEVVFAHFLFLSHDLNRLERLFERHENIHVDVTPGTQLYLDSAHQTEKMREFFIMWKDRILFGSDIELKGETFDPAAKVRHIELIRRFLETDEITLWGPDHTPVKGLALPGDVLRAIYHENFVRIAGAAPRPINRDEAIEECDRLATLARRVDPPVDVPRGLTQAREMIAAAKRAS